MTASDGLSSLGVLFVVHLLFSHLIEFPISRDLERALQFVLFRPTDAFVTQTGYMSKWHRGHGWVGMYE